MQEPYHGKNSRGHQKWQYNTIWHLQNPTNVMLAKISTAELKKHFKYLCPDIVRMQILFSQLLLTVK